MDSYWLVESLQYALDIWNTYFRLVISVLTQTPEVFRGGTIWSTIVDINNGMIALADGLLVLFFLAGVAKSTFSYIEMKRPEVVLKLFIRFILAKTAVTYSLKFMLTLFTIIQGVIYAAFANMSTVNSLPSGLASVPQVIREKITSLLFIDALPVWVITMIGSLAITILAVWLILMVYGRMFKIFIYTAIAPVPLSTFAGESTSSIGVSFIKSYAAVCLDGAIIVLACIIYGAYTHGASEFTLNVGALTTTVVSVYSYLFEVIFNMIILVGLVRASSAIAKEIIGH